MLKIERSVFLVAFAFVLLAGGLLQLVVLPMTPWHAGFGLMAGGDWVRFHQLAVELAAVVRQEGWGSWVLRVEGQAPASVAAALYVITGIERPWVLLPLHGLLYATTAATLYSIANSLTVKRRFSLILLLPLFVFPSSAMIWGQIHKDIYSMTGILLVLRFWIQVWRNYVQGGGALHASVLGAELLTLTTGMILVVFVRPYLGQVVLLASLVAAIVLLAYFSMPSQLHRKKIERAHKEWRVLVMVLVGFVLELMVISLSVRQQELVAPSAGEARSEEWARSIGCGVWLPSVHLPMAINQRLARLACAREAFRHGYSHAGSKIDADTGFKSPAEVLGYLPRASQIALFSPFPNQWFKDGVQPGAGVMRTLVIPEMLVFYVALPGVLLALLVSGIRAPVMMAFLFALTVVLAHVLVITNVGTLYRMRFPAMLIWILIGGIGWRAWFDRHRTKAL